MWGMRHNMKMGRCTGQALAEVAVFGAFFLLLLAALINYGLRFNFSQDAEMKTFRRALHIASDIENRGQGSYMLVKDKHIPDPSGLSGIGSTTPITATASVVRDYHLHAQAVDAESLNGAVTDIQTSKDTGDERWNRRFYKTAAFRAEAVGAAPDKYKLIYGDSNVNEAGGYVIDSCSGEIVDYDSCFSQARMLVDVDYCIHICAMNGIPGSNMDCNGACNQQTSAPNQSNPGYNGGAWYAANYTYTDCTRPDGTHDRCYTFPILDQLFSFTSSRKGSILGIRADVVTNQAGSESLHRTETPTDVTTEESVDWKETLNRKITTNNNVASNGWVNSHGAAAGYVNPRTEDVHTVVSVSDAATMSTTK